MLVKCFAGCSVEDITGAVGLTVAALFPAKLTHHRAPERRPFDPMQVLLGVAHEAITVAIVAEDFRRAGNISDADRDRLGIACGRIQRALSALGDLPEAEEMRRIRRGEVSMPQSAA